MPLKNFCCCYDLRAGCIALAWLQLMGITLIIATLVDNEVVKNIVHHISDHIEVLYKSDNRDNCFVPLLITGIINLVPKIAIGILSLKAITCIAMTWGIVKRWHLCYQPWLFIVGIEASVSSVAVLVFFVLGCTLHPIFFIIFILHGTFTALNWYFWACVYTVYQEDIVKQLLSPHELATKV